MPRVSAQPAWRRARTPAGVKADKVWPACLKWFSLAP